MENTKEENEEQGRVAEKREERSALVGRKASLPTFAGFTASAAAFAAATKPPLLAYSCSRDLNRGCSCKATFEAAVRRRLRRRLLLLGG